MEAHVLTVNGWFWSIVTISTAFIVEALLFHLLESQLIPSPILNVYVHFSLAVLLVGAMLALGIANAAAVDRGFSLAHVGVHLELA